MSKSLNKNNINKAIVNDVNTIKIISQADIKNTKMNLNNLSKKFKSNIIGISSKYLRFYLSISKKIAINLIKIGFHDINNSVIRQEIYNECKNGKIIVMKRYSQIIYETDGSSFICYHNSYYIEDTNKEVLIYLTNYIDNIEEINDNDYV